MKKNYYSLNGQLRVIMRTLLVAVVMSTGFSVIVMAQAVDPNNYAFSTTVGLGTGCTAGQQPCYLTDIYGNAIDLSGSTTIVAQNVSGNTLACLSSVRNIGFDFYFMGSKQTQFFANLAGVIGFPANTQYPSTTSNPATSGNVAILSTTTYTSSAGVGIGGVALNTMTIGAFSGSANSNTKPASAKVHYKTYGTAPNRVCVIEWKDISITSVSSTGIASVLSNYQVRLYETTNKIEFLYANVTNPVGVGGCMTARGGFFINGATSGYACLQNLLNAASTGPTNSYPPNGTLGTLNRSFSCTSNSVSPAYTALGTNRQVLYDPITGTTNAAPTNLAFTSINATDVNLTWTASATARSYDIYYSTNSSVPLDGTSGYVSAGPNATTIATTTVTPDGTTNGTTTITFASAPQNVWVGAKISGTNIPAGATITSIQATGITISAAATGSGTTTLTTGQNAITGLTTGTTYYFKVFTRRESLSAAATVSGVPAAACTAPTTQATIGAFTNNNTGSSVTVNWSRGDGDSVMVVGRLTSGSTVAPTSGTNYSDNTTFGSGSNIGSGNYVIYKGTGTSVGVTGLSISTDYTFIIYEYKTTGVCFKTPGSSGNVVTVSGPTCSYPVTQATIGAYTNNTTGNTITANWSRGDGDGVIVVARKTSTANVLPSDGVSYTSNNAFGSGTGSQITGTGNFVVYKGTGSTVDVTTLTMDTNYTFTVYEYTATGNCYKVAGSSSTVTVVDATPPVISYTALSNTFSTSNRLVSSITITDAVAGVNITAGTKPRLYYKKSTDDNTYVGNTSSDNGWKYVEASGTTSPFSFTINYSLINGGSISVGDVVQYFVVAQDKAATPNLQINSGTFNSAPNSVDLTAGAFALTGTINSYTITNLSGAVTVGTGGDFTSFTRSDGFFNFMNNSTVVGNITVTVVSSISNEDGTVALNQWSESGGGNYTLTITSDGRTISGSYAGSLLRLNGADRVTFNGGTGAQRYLIFENTNASVPTLSLLNDATNNSFNNCTFKGGTPLPGYGGGVSTGIVYIGTGSSTGNDNNTFNNCDFTGGTAGLPNNCFYAAGTAGAENDNITISNCNIYNFNYAASVNGINVTGTGNGNNWTISGNSFYSTVSSGSSCGGFIPINFNPGSTSTGNTISGNYIGGTAASCGGSSWGTFPQCGGDNVWTAIYVNAGTGTATNVTNNIFQNISNNGSNITGIEVAGGTVNVGNGAGTGNTIGGSATVSPYNITANAPVVGIKVSGGTVNVLRNTISGIANITSTVSISFTGILITGGDVNVGNGAGTGNTIGSASSGTAISLSTTSTNPGYGIRNTGTGTVLIANNTVAGLESTHALVGIQSSNASGGSSTISNNNVYTLTSYDDDYMGTAPAGDATKSSTMGIWAEGNNAVTGNNVYGLNNSWSTSTYAYGVTGIYFRPTNTSASVERNFVHSLNLGGASASAFIYGISIGSNTNSAGVTGTVKNNMVRLGLTTTGGNVVDGAVNSAFVIAGIDKWSTAAMNIYHNSIYVGGSSVATGVVNTSAFRRSGAPSSGSDDVRNNIFMNARSNSTTGGNHYATVFNNTTGISSNYNLYYASGTGGQLGSYDGGTTPQNTVANLATASGTGQEANSLAGDPVYKVPAGTSGTVDLHIHATNATWVEGFGVAIGSVTDDYDGQTRSGFTPTDIGADAGDFVAQCGTAAPTGSASQSFCTGATVADLAATGTSIQWYAASSGGSPLATSTALVNNTHYYATQTVGCESTSRLDVTATVASCNFNYTVKFFLQGYYLGSGKMSPLMKLLNISGNATDVDTATIELRTAADPNTVAYSFKGILQANGNLVCTFPGAASGNAYYVVINHRNSLQTWSASAVTVSAANSPYDFTTGAGQAYGTGNRMANLDGSRFGIYSGDINQDGAINAADKLSLQSVLSTFLIGNYHVKDITGDGFVDEDDYRIMENNVPLSISLQRP